MNFRTLACTVFDERTGGQPETNMPRNFCEVGGIKKSLNIKDEFHFSAVHGSMNAAGPVQS